MIDQLRRGFFIKTTTKPTARAERGWSDLVALHPVIDGVLEQVFCFCGLVLDLSSTLETPTNLIQQTGSALQASFSDAVARVHQELYEFIQQLSNQLHAVGREIPGMPLLVRLRSFEFWNNRFETEY